MTPDDVREGVGEILREIGETHMALARRYRRLADLIERAEESGSMGFAAHADAREVVPAKSAEVVSDDVDRSGQGRGGEDGEGRTDGQGGGVHHLGEDGLPGVLEHPAGRSDPAGVLLEASAGSARGRARCSFCGEAFAVTKAGRMRKHLGPDGVVYCRDAVGMSPRPAAAPLPGLVEEAQGLS